MNISFVRLMITLCFQGTIFFLIYLCLLPLLKSNFTQKWHYVLLKINMLNFLFPISIMMEKIEFADHVTLSNVIKTPVPNVVEKFIDTNTQTKYSFDYNQVSTFDTADFILAIWVVGFMIFLTYNLTCVFLFQKEIALSEELQDKEIVSLLQKTRRNLKIRNEVKIYYNDTFTSPIVFGIFRPKILLPRRIYSEKILVYIFTHELTHIKRHDLFFKSLLLVIEAIFWFNPLMYFFRKEFEKRLEYACDEEIAEKLDFEQRKEYGFSIIETSAAVKGYPKTHYGLGFVSKRNQLKWRLNNMLNLKKMSKRKKALAMTLAVGLTVGGTLTAQAMSNAPDELSKIEIETKNVNDTSLIKNSIVEKDESSVTTFSEEKLENAKLDMEMKLGETNEKATNSINWKVPTGNLVYGGNLSMEVGESITINVAISPMDKTVKVGIVEPDGTFRYVNGKGSIGHTFAINKRGQYKVAVMNTSGSSVQVSGFVKY